MIRNPVVKILFTNNNVYYTKVALFTSYCNCLLGSGQSLNLVKFIENFYQIVPLIDEICCKFTNQIAVLYFLRVAMAKAKTRNVKTPAKYKG